MLVSGQNFIGRWVWRQAVKSGWFLMLALIVCCGEGTSAQERKVPAWPPRAFPISSWCSPPDAFITKEQYRRMADAGFTVVMPPCEGAASVERNLKILDTAKSVGMKAVLADARMPLSLTSNPMGKANLDAIVKDYKKHPALLGYFLTDEPGAGAFGGLAEVVAYLKQIDPEHVAYINLLPNYATTNQNGPNSQLGTDTYDEYLSQYLQKVKPDVLSYDHYHFLKTSDRPGFLANLASAQRATTGSQSGRATPFWQIVLSVEHGPYRMLSESELRYEAMQTLAHGGQGLMYFTYWLPNDPSFEWKNAIFNRDGTPGPLYEPVKKINGEVRELGKWLYGATVIRTYLTGEATNEGEALNNNAPVRIEGPGNLSIGLFRDSKGILYYLFTNRDYRKTVVTKAVLHVKQHPTEQLNVATGKWTLFAEPRNKDGELTIALTLGPAGTALIRSN